MSITRLKLPGGERFDWFERMARSRERLTTERMAPSRLQLSRRVVMWQRIEAEVVLMRLEDGRSARP
jgi:hypothetical protein